MEIISKYVVSGSQAFCGTGQLTSLLHIRLTFWKILTDLKVACPLKHLIC